MQWLLDNYIEVLGAAVSLVYLYFSYKQIIWLWPLGILSSVLYCIVFFHSALYADMSLQIYYFFISFYGWYFWLSGRQNKTNGNTQLEVNRLSLKMWVVLIFIWALLTLVIGLVLSRFTNSSLPWWDAFTTAGGIVGTWMLARKILENWLFWIIIDLVSMSMYIYKNLYPTVVLFFIYSIIAVAGYYRWKKDLKKI